MALRSNISVSNGQQEWQWGQERGAHRNPPRRVGSLKPHLAGLILDLSLITAVPRIPATGRIAGGHRRTRRRFISSTGGTSRTPKDTREHGSARVRDREAPGSNPGPPTRS